MARTHLDHPCWSPGPEQHEQGLGIEPAELGIVGRITTRGGSPATFRVIEIGDIARELHFKKLAVTGIVEIDARRQAWLRRPQPWLAGGDFRAIQHRGIEMPRGRVTGEAQFA